MRQAEFTEMDEVEAGKAVARMDRELAGIDAPREAVTDLVAMAIDRDLDIEKLRALIDMRNAQEEREAKRVFDTAFAAMRAEFAPVERAKSGDKSKYAPIDAMQMQYDPIIARHGFSYWWDEAYQADGGLLVTMTISGHGHAKTNTKHLPPYEPHKGSQSGKAIMNELQAEGVRSSYGRRYTFIAGFGITVRDEDTDGRMMSASEVARLTPALAAIGAAATAEDLKTAFFDAYNATTDATTRKLLTEAKDRRKKEIAA